MDFKDDAEYAGARHPLVHRALSLAIVIAHAGFVWFKYDLGQAFRLSAWFVLPLAYIWKCDDLATWWTESGPSSSDDPAKVRLGGWMMLFTFLALRIYAYVSAA